MRSQKVRVKDETGHHERHRHRCGQEGQGPTILAKESARAYPGDQIAKRAYEIYLERGAEDSHALEDWLRAEAQIIGS
jgi:Protein of unknown function (DUF2934)